MSFSWFGFKAQCVAAFIWFRGDVKTIFRLMRRKLGHATVLEKGGVNQMVCSCVLFKEQLREQYIYIEAKLIVFV